MSPFDLTIVFPSRTRCTLAPRHYCRGMFGCVQPLNNIAAGANASGENATTNNLAALAIDRIGVTYYESEEADANQYIQFDLGSNHTVLKIVVLWGDGDVFFSSEPERYMPAGFAIEAGVRETQPCRTKFDLPRRGLKAPPPVSSLEPLCIRSSFHTPVGQFAHTRVC